MNLLLPETDKTEKMEDKHTPQKEDTPQHEKEKGEAQRKNLEKKNKGKRSTKNTYITKQRESTVLLVNTSLSLKRRLDPSPGLSRSIHVSL